jgi:DNA-binding GntR family transcriptional regulator
MADVSALAGLAASGPRQSLVDVAYVALRDAITSGTLLPGTRLREAALAQHLSISTTPVREALRRLDREGLVRLSPNRGAVVAAFDLREILDLFEVREVLECRAVRRAAGQRTRYASSRSVVARGGRQVVPRYDRVE